MPNLRCKKRSNIGQRTIGEHFILYPLAEPDTWLFNLSAAELWEVLDRYSDFPAICQEIARRNRCSVADVSQPVEAFLHILNQCRLAELFEDDQPVPEPKRPESMNPAFQALCLQEHILILVLLEVTYQCNLLCRHCYLCEHYDGLSLEKIEDIFAQLQALQVVDITVSGGELFLREDVFAILQGAVRFGFRTTIISNGTLLTDEIIERLSELPVMIKLSIYSLDPAVHDLITGVPGSQQKTMKAFRQLCQTGKQVTVGTILQQENAPGIPELKAYVEEMGGIFSCDHKIFPDHEGDEHPLSYSADAATLTRLLRERIISPIREISCEAAHIKAKIDPSGYVYPCELLHIPLGNLHEQSFAEIWNGDTAVELRQRIREYQPPKCSGCANRDHCVRCPAYVWTDGNYPNTHHEIMCFMAHCYQQSTKEEIPACSEKTQKLPYGHNVT